MPSDGRGRERLELSAGWELAGTAPGACDGPGGLGDRAWIAAPVPGTVAGALTGAGQTVPDIDQHDWWYRTTFDASPAADGEEVALVLDGLATVAEVFLNGRQILAADSMFAAHRVDVGGALAGRNHLAICCRALTPRLKERRRPRARWRTKLVAEGNLRFFRTMLIGRAPGFAPGPAVAGPWRPVGLERSRGLVCDAPRLRARVRGEDGVLECQGELRGVAGAPVPESLRVAVGDASAQLAVDPETGRFTGEIVVPGVALWWPHTHGTPALYDVTIGEAADPMYRTRVGFRTLVPAADLLADGPDLQINGVRVFARGAVWVPVDQRDPHASEPTLRRVLQTVVNGGLNMLRVAGIGCYESNAFHDLCDELGILVWQDFMFANLDYPEQDADFMATVKQEARAVLHALAPRPSLAILCGGSEVAQQVAMLGLDPSLAAGPLYAELLPDVVAAAEVDAPYIPSAPWGGDLPFRTDRGVANYYGVGAYLRPFADVRRAEVRFAAECLAFANVPDESALNAPGGAAIHHPAWKAGVPRDAGSGWDFDDVRDHYLRVLFHADPVALRWVDPKRYLELSRTVSGEVMAEVFGEWRRAQSPCAGGLVLWLKDLRPGAGWGVLDHRGEPKVAHHHLRRALAPVAVWTTDEGLGGVVAHVANDRPEPLVARLRVGFYSDFSRLVDETVTDIQLAGRSSLAANVEALLGRFVDAAWAYRFGPAAHDLIAVSLERDREDGTVELISQAFRFPAGRPRDLRTAAELGLEASLVARPGAAPALRVATGRFAYGVRAVVPGYRASDDAFGIEPGHERLVTLHPIPGDEAGEGGVVTALTLAGRVRLTFEG
jgi:beta-mannosidase